MTIQVLDPTSESNPQEIQPAQGISSLKGKRVGFISNGKEGTPVFFAHLERLLKERWQVAEVVLRTKSNYSAPAQQDFIDAARDWDLAITGLGD